MALQLRRTKIIATLGPATDAPGMLERLLVEGVDIVRLNLSHGVPDDHKQARGRRARSGRSGSAAKSAMLADLQGPKIRIERFANGPVQLEPNQSFTLDCREDAAPGDATRVGVSYHDLWRDVKRGRRAAARRRTDLARSARCRERSRFTAPCITGGRLSDRKGINRLGGGLTVAALSDKDRADIVLTAELEADFLAVSFVKTADDIEQARALLKAAGGTAALVAKIERAEAIDNLTDDRRGVGCGHGRARRSRRRDRRCGVAGPAEEDHPRGACSSNRVVITATQMMQSMVESPIPTRAEVLDVANAVIDGTDAVMLSQETAAGKHPDKAVAAMRRVCLGAERQFVPIEDLQPDGASARSHRSGDRARRDVSRRAGRRARDHRADRIGRDGAMAVALPLDGADLRTLARRRRAAPHAAVTAT